MVQISNHFADNVLKILKNDAKNTTNSTYTKVLTEMYDQLYDKLNKRKALGEAKHALQLISRHTNYPQTRKYIMNKPELKRYLNYVDSRRYYRMLKQIEAEDVKHDRQDRIVDEAHSLQEIKNDHDDVFYAGSQKKDADTDKRNSHNTKSDLKRFLHKLF